MLPVRDNSALREVLTQVGCHGSRVAVDSRHQMEYLVPAPPAVAVVWVTGDLSALPLDHPLDHPDDPTGSVWIRLDR
jgi:hypothetical protein